MKTYRIPRTDLIVSRLAFGCAMLGVDWTDAAFVSKTIPLIRTALQQGITFFDLADSYAYGKAEVALGEVLKSEPALRPKIVIQSKCGDRLREGWLIDNTREYIVQSVERSLMRLGIEYLDLLLLHWHDTLVELEEIAQAFDELQRSGKVRYFGVSNHSPVQIELLKTCVEQPLVVNQIQLGLGHWHVVPEPWKASLTHVPEGVTTLEYCRLHDIQVQAYSPLRAGKFNLLNPAPDDPQEAKHLAQMLADLAKREGVTPAAIMLAWLLRHPAGIVPVLGAIATQHLIDNCAAERVELSRVDWYALLHAGTSLLTPGNPINFARFSAPAKYLWAHDNFVAWQAASYDMKKRTPEARAKMLSRLGFKRYAYVANAGPLSSMVDVNVSHHDVDSEIDAMRQQDINIFAWHFALDGDPTNVPAIKATLETFRHYNIRPQIWLTHSHGRFPNTVQEWRKIVPKEIALPRTMEDYERLLSGDRQALHRVLAELGAENFSGSPDEQEFRVRQEADWVHAFVRLAAPYGCTVNLCNHGGWFGRIESQLAIIRRLEAMGVTNVGVVYNFSHSRDQQHDDLKDFPQLWERIKNHVVAVNVLGISDTGYGYPSQGTREIAMMRTIQESGWDGPIGVPGVGFGDTEATLRNAISGIDWIAAELRQPGSGGLPPFPAGQSDLIPAGLFA